MKEIIENCGSNDKHPAIRLIRNVVFWFESSAVAPAVVIKKSVIYKTVVKPLLMYVLIPLFLNQV